MRTALPACLSLIMLAGCAVAPLGDGSPGPTANLPPAGAEASLVDSRGRPAGRAEFFDAPFGGTLIRIQARGLTPGAHGLHVHEQGRCEGPDFMSAGAHLKEAGGANPHGLLHPQGGEAGDLPNLIAQADGTAEGEFTSYFVRVNARDDDPGVTGRAIMIHANPDDHSSAPTGGTGDRIVCGVIRPAR